MSTGFVKVKNETEISIRCVDLYEGMYNGLYVIPETGELFLGITSTVKYSGHDASADIFIPCNLKLTKPLE